MDSSYDIDNLEQRFRPAACHWQAAYQQTASKSIKENNGQVGRDKERLARLIKEFKSLGVPHFFWTHAEARELVRAIDDGEVIKGVLYGYTRSNFAVLVATHKRILFVEKRHAEISLHEIGYAAVKSITFENAGLFNLVTLHTKTRNYSIRTLNLRSAEKFMNYVEAKQAFRLARSFGNDQTT